LAPRDLKDVHVYAPKDFIGIMNTAVSLLSANQRLIESRAARLEWIAKVDSSPPSKRMESGALNAPGIQLMNAEDAALMERGRDLLKSGDIASARLLFQRLADAGIADAALALAATYDPRYLAQHNLIGAVGDETKAHDWYKRASELGSIEAVHILAEQMPTNRSARKMAAPARFHAQRDRFGRGASDLRALRPRYRRC
jgi:TPR repeat protein